MRSEPGCRGPALSDWPIRCPDPVCSARPTHAVNAATPPGTKHKEERTMLVGTSLYLCTAAHSSVSVIHERHSLKPNKFFIYLANGVLVLTEEGLKFEMFGGGQRSDLSVGSDRHRGRLGQQTVEQPQQRERHQTALRRSDRRRERKFNQNYFYIVKFSSVTKDAIHTCLE